jgi:RNA polymerase sigma-70 factor (ECF subfamily)
LPLSDCERELLRGARRRDPRAFGELYVAYYRAVYLEIFGLTRNPDESDDLTSDVFLRAWNAIDRFEDRGYSLETWLKKIARNLAVSHIGRRGRQAPSVELDWLVDPALTPDEQADVASDTEAVRQAMIDLPAIQRQVLNLRFFDDMSYNEVAEVIGKPEGAIRVIQHRALQAMRELLLKGRLKPALPPASGGGE